MDNTYCVGGERNLTDCRFDGWGVNDCHETEAAGVVCRSGPVSLIDAPPPTTAATTTTTTTSTTASPATALGARKLQQDMAPRKRIKVAARKNRNLLTIPPALVFSFFRK